MSGPQFLRLLRGKKAAYCSTLEGPYDVEADDIPDEVTASVLGVGTTYSILVEGSDPVAIPHAVRFAKRLAKAGQGVVMDLQTDELWPKTSTRRAAKPEKDTIVDLVDVRWYHLMDEVPDDFPQRYLDLARQILPEAVPTRFGSFEPLQGNLARDGDSAFTAAFAGEYGNSLFARGTFPVSSTSFSGVFGGNTNQDDYFRQGDVQTVSLNIHRTVLEEPAWRKAFERFIVAVSTELRSFYTTVEVDPGWHWNGRSLWTYASHPTRYHQKTNTGRWQGLTTHPTWMSWFSPLYANLVRPHLQGTIQEYPEGLLHSFGDGPLDSPEIIERWPDATQWLPAELTAVADPSGKEQFADFMPERLTQMLIAPPTKPKFIYEVYRPGERPLCEATVQSDSGHSSSKSRKLDTSKVQPTNQSL
ncbi:hypothetical protein SAMN04489740_4025 [Arthrobacter alpinus]|uniref:Uncharacterized protein n=1 Tax=Arthrobacter alpinus TaxID=656366 RepID=A0A1H5PAU9_9MICC|nr:hypothetical protein [Arthrobacter alpinus]SEF10734.1 hypothetical protein SAMN04489740_4025 [Arthrobacter alpinus]